MADAAEDPISCAIAALARAQRQDLPPATAEACKEAQTWLLEAAEERRAFMAVAHNAMALVETLDEYEEAIEAGDEGRIGALNEASAERTRWSTHRTNCLLSSPMSGKRREVSGLPACCAPQVQRHSGKLQESRLRRRLRPSSVRIVIIVRPSSAPQRAW